jgi:hypothetical protein
MRDPQDPDRLRAIPVPEDIKAACTLPDTVLGVDHDHG